MKGLEDSELILFFLSLSFQRLKILCSCYVRTIENIEFRSFFRSDEGLTLELETVAHELVIFTLSTGHVFVLFFGRFRRPYASTTHTISQQTKSDFF